MDWSVEQVNELTRLWGEDHTASEIGRRMGLTRNQVIGKAHRLGLASRPSPIRYVDGLTFHARLQRRRLQRRAQRAQAGLKPVKILKFKKQPPKGLPMWNSQKLSPTKTCQHIAGDPKVDPTMCGQPAVEGRPYCPDHCAACYIVYQPKPKAEAA